VVRTYVVYFCSYALDSCGQAISNFEWTFMLLSDLCLYTISTVVDSIEFYDLGIRGQLL
jgi:hypothetical protein